MRGRSQRRKETGMARKRFSISLGSSAGPNMQNGPRGRVEITRQTLIANESTRKYSLPLLCLSFASLSIMTATRLVDRSSPSRFLLACMAERRWARIVTDSISHTRASSVSSYEWRTPRSLDLPGFERVFKGSRRADRPYMFSRWALTLANTPSRRGKNSARAGFFVV